MQLLTLEFEGIGPFTGRHLIDVRALGEGGLFLLEGPTGSGKTTIIDAIVFALYGDVAGVDSSKGRLVSTQLPAGVEPFVEATLETARGLFRVRRVPQYERRRARGSGTTVGRASIKLWRLAYPGDEGVLLSTSFQEASEELQRAIGLTKEQFTQTVVLPQGHFATFLRAKPEERRGVLQDIFGTEFYERVARKLSELAARFRQLDADARAALSRAGSSFALVGLPADERPGFEALLESDASAAVALASGRSETLANAANAARALAHEAECRATSADTDLRLMIDRNAAIAERAKLLTRRAALEASGEAVVRAESRLEAAERAEHVRRPIEAVAKARAGLEAANADAARAVAALAEGPDSDLAALGSEALEAAGLVAREAVSALRALVEVESGLGSRADQHAIEIERLASRTDELARERQRVEGDRAKASELGPEFAELLALANTRAACGEAEVRARTAVDNVLRLESIADEFVQARAAEQSARAEASERAAEHARARAAWLSGLAGTLAQELAFGGACPVCGSTKHPAPAQRPAGAADRVTVEKLDALARAAGEASAAAQARSDGLATAMSDQQAVVGDLTRLEASMALAEASEAKRMAELAAVRASEVRDRIEALLAGADQRERALFETERQLAVDSGHLDARAERLEADRQRVRDQLSGHDTIAERASALSMRADRAKRLVSLARGSGEAVAGLAARESELAEALSEQGFSDVDAVRAALLDEPERRRMREAVQQHREQWASVVERLADERLVAVEGAEPDAEGPLRQAAAEARAAAESAMADRGAAEQAAGLAAEASAELERSAQALAGVHEQAEPYLRMADLAQASGGNRKNVTLPTFVLLQRFEEVVDLANVRLDSMTGGRYALRRTDAREGRSQKLGLGLEVVDHASGDAVRDPKTLSGGETFQASLAMALGLADAVTAEAGGVELSTLFVDEGFGSLDPEALDLVMDQLTALRDGGRSVGVVSHVAEMKQRIAERITVVPRRDGTSTLTTSLDAQPALAG